MNFVSDKQARALVQDTLGPGFEIKPLTGGLLNQNFSVRHRLGPRAQSAFVLKIYRPEVNRTKLEDTHRVMAHVARHGIPVPLPVATYAFSPPFQGGGRGGWSPVAALYPHVEGAHPPRYGLGARRAEILGETLGRIDRALDSFRPGMRKPSSLEVATWDPELFAKELVGVRASVRRKPNRMRAEVERVVDVYERILSVGDWDKQAFARLPVRMCHGDYHMYNLLMRHGEVAAVLDWEKAGWDWRGFEIMRSTMFLCRRSSGSFCWDDVRAYLRGYARDARLSDAERALAFDCGFTKAFFSLWAVKRYVAGETRVRDNMLRRAEFLPYLFKHRAKFAQRIASLLA